MNINTEKLKELLVGPGHIGEADFESADKQAKKQKAELADVLVEKEFIKDAQLGQVMAEALEIPFVDLTTQKIDEEVFELVPELVARSKQVIAFTRDDQSIRLGMVNPEDIETVHLIEKRAGMKASRYMITKRQWQQVLSRYKASLKDTFENILATLQDPSLSREERDETTVEMVDMLLQYGYQNKASDIHIEPYEKKIVVRFRIDGVMHDVLEIPKDLAEFIFTRIKIMAKMRTDEHRAAQDGKLQFLVQSGSAPQGESEEETVDVRVSIVPVTEGENIVMRLLSSHSRQFNLSSLGLQNDDLDKLKAAAAQPHGMILVTGPTGSGKTTSLYAVMKILNKREIHISTIEDPVEYDIEGISQIQVNPKTELTFAKGLRAIVRQDPDIIMVGEIRDEETASIAINSAMTGHLVLSTLHTNDAATTLPRLLDMGIEPFLVASTINIAIAQRLVRKICETCRSSYSPSEKELKLLKNLLLSTFTKPPVKISSRTRLYKGKGCKVCGSTGYIGRVGVFEVLEMKENIKELIIKRASSDEIVKAARSNGMTTMLEDGIQKVLQGVTTLEEILRVTKE
jgi:type IV pilus assembly protein PilB